jgi:hypothetical protein
MMFPKHEYVRSKELLKNARKIACQHCGKDDGTVVAAHGNWQGGKGKGIKCDDNLIASLCFSCHTMIDQGQLEKELKQDYWYRAHKKTVYQLIYHGLWPENVPLPDVPTFLKG